MIKRLSELKNFNFRLWIALCSLALIPAIYQTVNTFLISSTGQSGALDIIGQMEWFDFINETLQAFLIVPLYSVLNKAFKKENGNFAEITFKTLIISFALYTLFSVGVLIYGTHLISVMDPTGTDIASVSAYLRLETVAFMTGIAVSFTNVVFVVIGKDKNVYIFLGLRTVLSLMADFILIPYLDVYGVAISGIVTNTILSAICIFILYRQRCIRFSRFDASDRSVLTHWAKTGLFSGAQQFVDNIVYAVMVCKMVNEVAAQGNYWVANNFIWGWLLIPITALAEVVRSDCKDGYKKLKHGNYRFVAVACILLWIITIPLWTPFFRYAQGLENAEEIFAIVIKLTPFYIAYAGCAIIDSVFIGIGKTSYNAINSLIINFGYYGIFFILYKTKAIVFGMNTIILMFGFGMAVHLLISVIQEKMLMHKNEATKSDAHFVAACD